jgi:hypothetical protein
VQIWNSALTKQLDSVTVGDTVILKVVPQNNDGTAFTNALSQAQAGLYSGFTLWSTASNPMAQLTFPQGITGATTKLVVFTKVPSGGIEIVSIAGICRTSTDTAIFQGSAVVHVIGGAPVTGAKNNPNVTLQRKRHIDVTCFNLLGRVVFHMVTESYAGSIQAKDFQNLVKNRISSGALIVRLSVNDGGPKPAVFLNKIIVP